MEECCVVCAEPLEWIAFGACGHREVCSTCTARMRVILNDMQCCICKQASPYIFVTKALGDYTRSIGDFSSLPQLVQNGKEKFWYEANVGGYFDDEEEFKRIKAMCKLYCTVCEQASVSEDVHTGFVKRVYTFKTLDLLRRHIYGVHKLLMCSLCLKGRKAFICEQKLYTKAQLEQHSSDGNSKVDGSEEERGGFGGHPLCDFCKKRFYGENELYQHMSIDHYTCHLCQRLRPGNFEYYHNYDDLEIHFRHEHILCEHPDCLEKKFIVFSSESEFKRHNATSHGGNMSRAQRNADLQIPVSFQFRRSGQAAHDDQGSRYRHGRRGRFRDVDAIPSSAEMETSNDVANLEEALHQSSLLHTSLEADSNSSLLLSEGPSETFPALVNEATAPIDPVNSSVETSRYLAAAQGADLSFQDSAFQDLFPPLPGKSKSARHRAKQRNQSAALSVAALLGGGRGGGIRVLNTARLKQSRSDGPEPSIDTNELARHSVGDLATVSRGQEESRFSLGIQSDASGHSICALHRSDPPPGENLKLSCRRTKDKASMSSLDQESTNQVHGKLHMDEIKAANKALVEQIKVSLNGDEQRLAEFKHVSSLFRKGEIGGDEFYKHVVRLGLPHVIPELARLCPDPQKQEELLKVHMNSTASNKTLNDESWPSIASTSSSYSRKMKAERCSKGKGMLQDEVSGLCLEKKARESIAASNEAVETLHTDGYRIGRGKSKAVDGSTALKPVPNGGEKSLKILVKAIPKSSSASSSRSVDPDPHENWTCGVCTLVNPSLQINCVACGSVPHSIPQKNIIEDENTPRKKKPSKSSKFHRVRLGEGSGGVDLSHQNSRISGSSSESSNTNTDAGGSKSFGRGVWKKQGGQRILSLAQRDAIIDEAYRLRR